MLDNRLKVLQSNLKSSTINKSFFWEVLPLTEAEIILVANASNMKALVDSARLRYSLFYSFSFLNAYLLC